MDKLHNSLTNTFFFSSYLSFIKIWSIFWIHVSCHPVLTYNIIFIGILTFKDSLLSVGPSQLKPFILLAVATSTPFFISETQSYEMEGGVDRLVEELGKLKEKRSQLCRHTELLRKERRQLNKLIQAKGQRWTDMITEFFFLRFGNNMCQFVINACSSFSSHIDPLFRFPDSLRLKHRFGMYKSWKNVQERFCSLPQTRLTLRTNWLGYKCQLFRRGFFSIIFQCIFMLCKGGYPLRKLIGKGGWDIAFIFSWTPNLGDILLI